MLVFHVEGMQKMYVVQTLISTWVGFVFRQHEQHKFPHIMEQHEFPLIMEPFYPCAWGPGWPCMHVLVSVNRRLRITYLPLPHLTPRTGQPKTRLCERSVLLYQKQAQFVQKGFLSSQRCSVTQLCVTSCTYVQWLNSDGATAATAWELNREAKQAWELTNTTQGRKYGSFYQFGHRMGLPAHYNLT